MAACSAPTSIRGMHDPPHAPPLSHLAVIAGVLIAGSGLMAGAGLSTSSTAASAKRLESASDRPGRVLGPVTARRLAGTMVANRRWIRRAAFSSLGFGAPAAISTKRLAGFPRHGRSFAILTNGDATLADDRNLDGADGVENGGATWRGSRDVTILRITLRVPRKATCLSVRFRFLSDEFPEFVNGAYNDAFIIELDDSTWNTISKRHTFISAPRNFAADAKGDPISVNAVGDASVRPSRAKGTIYDAATRLLRASTPVSPGRHMVYMSIFDQGDSYYDSAVFVDRLTLNRRKPCKSGAVKD
jgi:hypothetical protein